MLYAKEKQYPTPVDAVVAHWGNKSLNGAAGLQIAALKKYGLLTDEGARADRRVRLTDLAVTILNHPNDAMRAEAIRTAAMEPAIHKEMRKRYPSHLPSDATLEWELTRELQFTENGAKDFIRNYKATLAFARLDDPAVSPPPVSEPNDFDDEDEEPGDVEWPNEPASPALAADAVRLATQKRPQPGHSRFPIPLPSGHVVTIEGPFKLSESDWVFFRTILDALKPSLAGDEPDAL